jgi:putative MATE family efflux protein
MLSFYSEKAVAAVGLVNQFVFFMQLLYLMVAVGASILISQNLGARQQKEAGRVALGSIALGCAFAVVLSIGMSLSVNRIIGFYHLDPMVHRFAWQFLFIYSAGSTFTSLGMVQSAILRAHGHSRDPMIVNIATNIFNIIGNYCFIFGPFGIPVLGVVGVALSTVVSQAIGCVILAFRIRSRRDIELPMREILHVPWTVLKKILSIGVPSAGENVSYAIGQILIMRIIASMGTDALAASVYAMTILRFVFMTSVSIGNGTQIKTGYWIGAKMYDEAYRKVLRYFGVGFCTSIFLVAIVFMFRAPIVHIFTKNSSILSLMTGIWIVSLFLEPARNFNVIIIPALKGAGDVRYPVLMGMLLMWGIGVVFAYVFGISLHWGLMGVWIALAADEWIRGIVMLFRWKSGRWRTKAFTCAA